MTLNKISLLLITVLILTINSPMAYTQIPQVQDESLEQLIENTLQAKDDETAGEPLTELLDYYLHHPLDLNTASYEQLMQLELLTEWQVHALLLHREKNGELLAIYELQSIDYWDIATIERVLPFVMVKGDIQDKHLTTKDLFTRGKNQFFVRYQQILEKSAGYIPDTLPSGALKKKYLGSRFKLYTRYRHYYANKISYGITAEKDAGEMLVGNAGTYKQRSFDFYSAHLFIRDAGIFSHIAVGDYEVRIGQGLIIYQGMSFGKSAMVMNIKKGGHFLRPYTSSAEAGFMRGAAATIVHRNFHLTAFLSYKGIDANVSATDSISHQVTAVSSLLSTGYHRTFSELAGKNAVMQTIAGGNITFQKKNFLIGTTTCYTFFDAPLKKNSYIYNQFEFSGNQLTNFGLNYSYLVQNFNFFGEWAAGDNGGMAWLNGCLVSLAAQADIALLHRHYQRNYHALLSRAFAENSQPANEDGTYLGLVLRPSYPWKIEAYFDTYHFPWLKYAVNAPSGGYDALVQVTYQPNKVLSIYIRAKHENKTVNAPGNSLPIDFLADAQKSSFRFHIIHKPAKSWTLRSRIETILYKEGSNNYRHGFLIYQDCILKSPAFPFSVAARFALFDVDDYDARIYAYENDVLYAFSIPFFYNRGARFYLTTRYRLTRGWDAELRFARTYYSNIKTISSGYNEIKGNTQSEIKLQMRWMF